MTETTARTRLRRILAPANVLSVLAGGAVFVLGVVAWPSNRGALAATAVAAATTGIVWRMWWEFTRPPALDRLLAAPRLGSLPERPGPPAPTLVDPASPPATTYRAVAADLEARTTGQVLLVTGPAPGQGATTVAMNLAIAATQAGRRVLLVDGDPTGRGLSRYMGTGAVPGLTDLAAGRTSLRDVARLWRLGETSRLPVIPAGTAPEDPGAGLEGPGVTDMFDVVGERADLVLVDAPAGGADGAVPTLAAHADGTLLVVTPTVPAGEVAQARARLAAAGAPVLGYVVNRVRHVGGWWRSPIVRALRRAVTAFALIALLYGGFTGAQLWQSWRGVGRSTFDLENAQTLLPLPAPASPSDERPESPEEDVSPFVTAPATPEEAYRSFLLIGGDQAAGAADVVLLLVQPADGREPFMVSLPRDLYLPNRCTGGYTRLNATIHGCGEINGPTLLALTIEDFTGIRVDHFAKFTFAGFEKIIDGVGGVQICVEHPVFDAKSHLNLPAGCTNATGAQALAWVRSRHTQEKVDGRWRSVPGAGDLLRNQHQQDVILELFKKLKTFASPADLTRKVAELSDAFTLDDRLGIGDAIALAWQTRDIDPATIKRLQIPVRLTRNKKGQSILVPTASFDEVLDAAYPGLLDSAGQASAPAG